MRGIIIYCYTVIFGGWLLKLAHCPSAVGLIFMQLVDYLPFLAFPFLFKLKKSYQVLPNTAAFWCIVLLFLILSFFTTIYHGGEIMSTVAHFGAMFRYVPLAGLFYTLKISDKDVALFYKHFCFISFVLVAIGYVEIFGGEPARSFFLPLTQEHSSASLLLETAVDASVDEISGIFPNTVDYAYFLLISFVIVSNSSKVTKKAGVFWLYLIPIYFSGSKAVLITFLLCTSFGMNNMKVLRTAFVGILCVGAVILICQFWELFYYTVFINSQHSRLGYIIFTLPCFLQELSLDTFIGVSPDKLLAYLKINSYPNAPMMTWEVDHMTAFEDEFYVALPVYYGLIGFGLLVWLFVGMYKTLSRAKWINNLLNYNVVVKSLFVILLIAPLFNQIIILKPFAIFFWCWIGIIMMQTTTSYR